MSKKGQVTLFVIVAIVIVGGILAYYLLFGGKGDSGSGDAPVGSEDVYNLVRSCFEDNAERAVLVVLLNGGYYNIPDEIKNKRGIAYYFLDGKISIPDELEVSDALSLALEEEVINCVDGFEGILGKEVLAGEISGSSEVLDDKIVFGLEYPLTISVGEDKVSLKDFGQVEVETKFGVLYKDVVSMFRSGLYNNGELCLSCIGLPNKDGSSVVVIDDSDGENKDYSVLISLGDDLGEEVGFGVIGVSGEFYDSVANLEEDFKYRFGLR